MQAGRPRRFLRAGARVLGRKNLKTKKDVTITNFAIEHLLEYR
jgi:hypothetical protein